MTQSFIKKILITGTLSLSLSFQLVASASATANEAIWSAAQKGVDYLAANQGVDGGVVGVSDVTDWAVIAVAASGRNQTEFNNAGVSAVDYLLTHPLDNKALATDVEKRILAITAAGRDTTDFGGVDYNELLATYHNNNQIGDPTLLNDDIFGILAVRATGDDQLKPMAQDALDFLIAHQGIDGGFSYTTNTCAYCGTDSNDTAAALVALQAAEAMQLTHDNLDEARQKAIDYIMDTKQTDGGFGYDMSSPSDGSSTAWVLIALNALDDAVAAEITGARDWLLANQNSDGGFSFGAYGIADSDVYTSAHAVIALLGTTWLLQPEPIEEPTAPVVVPSIPTTNPVPTITRSSTTHTVQAAAPAPTSTPIHTTPISEVLDATKTPQDQPIETPPASIETPDPEPAKTKSQSNWIIFGVGVLILVAASWFILQSKSKDKE